MTETVDFSYSFEPDDEIRIDGERHDYVGGYKEGHAFKRPGDRHRIFLSHDQIVSWTKSERLTIEKREIALSRRHFAAAGNEVELGRLPEEEAERLQYEYELTLLWRQFRAQLPNGHTTQGGKDALPLAYRHWVDLRAGQSSNSKPAKIYKMVGYSTICNYDALLRSRSDSIMALRDERHTSSGNFNPWLHPEVERVLQQAVDYYLHAGEPVTQTYAHRYYLAPEIYALKVRMAAQGLEGRFETPSVTTFKLRLAQVDKFHRIACRYSVEIAERKLRSKGQGLEIIRPGGRAEIDGWTIHLHVLLGDTEVWARLSPSQIAAIKSVRVIVVVIIDRATRSITGAHFSWSENKESMVAAIRLALSDKSHIAAAYGCNSRWPQRSAGNIVGDLSSAFKADDTARVILNSLGAQQFTIPGKPWLKGAIEAFFKRCSHDFVQAFLGIAWTDPDKKDTARALSKANVTFEVLREKFIRWIVDDYHREYQPALGTTPLQAWYKQGRKFPPRPEMSDAKKSALFSRIIKDVALTGAGVRVMGNNYHSKELQRLLEVGGERRVAVAVDDANLGQVSVCIPNDIDPRRVGFGSENVSRWITALGPKELAGVSSWQMSKADEQLLIQFGADDATSERVRNTARQELLAFHAAAARRTVFDHGLGQDLVERFAGGFHPGLRFASRELTSVTLTADDMHGPVQTGAARESAEVPALPSPPRPGPSVFGGADGDGDGENEIEIRFAADEGQ